MLKSWNIQNFKSFKKLPPVEFSMVNVLAGANSSGKSSLIQSILLLKQTLQYGSEDRAITFNGPLLRMGSFRDVRNFDAGGGDLKIGFEIDIKPEELSDQGRPHWLRSSAYAFQMGRSNQWHGISVSLTYGAQGGAQIADLYGGETNQNPSLVRTVININGTTEGNEAGRYFDFSLDSDSPWYRADTDQASNLEITEGKPEGRVVGGFISYFLPDFFVVRYNQTELDVSSLVESIFRPSKSSLGTSSAPDEILSQEVVEIINEWLIAHSYDQIPIRVESVMSSEVQAKFSTFLRPQYRSDGLFQMTELPDSIVSDVARLKTNIKNTILSERKSEYKSSGSIARGLSYATSYLNDFFKFGIRYLGPLRDSPRPVYQPEALEGTTDVGYRGEHTAAVFEINKRKRVEYRAPPVTGTEDDYVKLAKASSGALEDATGEWLEYLGVASSVVTKDAGVFGNRMQVSVEEGSPLHDLTNVGVGVSQVLPIVIMSLLAPRGSLLIFEQPELHLHPKVQARLADFFLALAIDGKQTILETHSEYLVDRLRLRIATSPSDNVRPLVNILFSEKEQGNSHLTPVEISEFGAILNWPTDFFEQSQRDVGRIIQAAARKRKIKQR